jgi:hypothetical protein
MILCNDYRFCLSFWEDNGIIKVTCDNKSFSVYDFQDIDITLKRFMIRCGYLASWDWRKTTRMKTGNKISAVLVVYVTNYVKC